jgi:hypothetical protein
MQALENQLPFRQKLFENGPELKPNSAQLRQGIKPTVRANFRRDGYMPFGARPVR